LGGHSINRLQAKFADANMKTNQSMQGKIICALKKYCPRRLVFLTSFFVMHLASLQQQLQGSNP
jgi:hypothetical protein